MIPLAPLTPLTIDGVKYILLQDNRKVLEMKTKKVYSRLISNANESFVSFDGQNQPTTFNQIRCYS